MGPRATQGRCQADKVYSLPAAETGLQGLRPQSARFIAISTQAGAVIAAPASV
jgi:hypothetical protein